VITVEESALAELLSSIGDCLTPETAARLINVRAPEKYQRRMENLAEKSTEGTLTPNEADEYRSLIAAGNFMAILQSKARQVASSART
jgi:hypothetical protein